MAAVVANSPFTTKVLFNLKHLTIFQKFITEDCVTMVSEKYICVRETNSVVIIDMTKPTQPIRLPITVDFAIMNPDTPILAFKLEDKIDEITSQDQLQMYDINTKTTLKSCNIAEKVECCKWISPKLLGLVTLKAVYHWSIQGLIGPVKMFDITNVVATSKITIIRNYMLDPSEKWVVLMGYKEEDGKLYHPIFARPYQGGDQWFKFNAEAATFTTFHVDGSDYPSTLLCSATGFTTSTIELSVFDGFGSQQGEPNFGEKQFKFYTVASENVRAVQISQKYGLIYVITERGLVSVHNLETAEAICTYNITEYKTYKDAIIRTIIVPNSENFYAINKRGQVLLTSVNDWSILSSINGKLLTKEKLHNLQKLCQQILKENEETVTNLEKSLEAEIRKKGELSKEIVGLKRQNIELQNESAKIITDLEESLYKMTEIKKQLSSMSTEIHNCRTSEKQMLIKIEQLQMEKAKQQIEKDDIITKLEKLLQDERRETKELLMGIGNEIQELKKENGNLQNEKDRIAREMTQSLEVEKILKGQIEEQLTSMIKELNKFQMLQEEMQSKIEALERQNTEVTRENEKYIAARAEIDKQLKSKMIELNNYHELQEEMQNKIKGLKDHNTGLTKENNKIIAEIAESLQIETSTWGAIKEQLKCKMTELKNYQKSQEELQNEIRSLKNQNTELTNESEKTIRSLEDFRLWIEGIDCSTNHIEVNITEFTRTELWKATNNFNDSLKIGEGGYGIVYKAFIGLTPVAIKIPKYENIHEFDQEVQILKRVRHPNVLMLLGVCRQAQAFIYELMPNGSLYDSLKINQQSSALTWKARIRIASNICSGLICLHSAKPHGIVHGDLKPANILLDSNYTAKLSDFGLCRHLKETDMRNTPHHNTTNPKGTLAYMDPEYLNTGEITTHYDVYSFGIVLLELVTGRAPMGLTKWVEDALQKKLSFVDAFVGEWPLEEAKRMVVLGLRCSGHSRENRPDLLAVWLELESLCRASLNF